MDIIQKLIQGNYRDIIISLPKDRSWIEYLNHFAELQSTNGIIKITLDQVPKSKSGNRCYIVFDGFLKGWMTINGITETSDGEICIELMPLIVISQQKFPMGEINGFKYYLDNFEMQ